MAMLTFTGSSDNDPLVLEWMADHQNELGIIAARWFKLIRQSGTDVTELLHDGYPTACVGDFPFAYVGAFKSHVNVGFFLWRRASGSIGPFGRIRQAHEAREDTCRETDRRTRSGVADRRGLLGY